MSSRIRREQRVRSAVGAAGWRQQARWPLQDARARLSTLVDEALAGRPQRIMRRGKEVAVLISAEEYARLQAPAHGLVEFFRTSPLAEAVAKGELVLERDRDPLRDVDL